VGSTAAAHLKGASGTTLPPLGKEARPGSSAVRAHAGHTFGLSSNDKKNKRVKVSKRRSLDGKSTIIFKEQVIGEGCIVLQASLAKIAGKM